MSETNPLTGYPSVDKPWLKYYSEDAINAPLPEYSIYEYLVENNKDALDSIAINYFGRRFSYRELFLLIDRAAVAFMEIGIQPGDTVTLVMLSCVSSVVSLYALNKIGAVCNFIDVQASQAYMEELMRDAESKYVVTMDTFCNRVINATKACGGLKIVVCSFADYMPLASKLRLIKQMFNSDHSYRSESICITWKDFLANSQRDVSYEFSKNPHTTCLLAHTSGTTGKPKTVLLSDEALNCVTQNYLYSMPHKRGEVFLSVMIPYVVYGTLINVHMPLCLGLETVLIPHFDASKWPYYIKKYKPHHSCSIPAYVSSMLEDKTLAQMDLSGLLTVGIGGDGMTVALEKKLNAFLESHGSTAKIQKGYGLSETCATAILEFKNASKVGSVGIPLVKNVAAAFDSDNKEECQYGESGEICLQCASFMLGYKGAENKDDSLMQTHPDGTCWLHTGDIGYVDEDGFVFLQGRMKRMIITIENGVASKVSPSNIEEVLNGYPNVRESCVVGITCGNNRRLKAYIAMSQACNMEESERSLRDLCSKELSEHMQPYMYEFVSKLPHTGSGKINYRELEENTTEDSPRT